MPVMIRVQRPTTFAVLLGFFVGCGHTASSTPEVDASAESLIDGAVAALSAGDLANAEALASQCKTVAPTNCQCYRTLAVTYARQTRIEEASESYAAYLANCPDAADGHVVRYMLSQKGYDVPKPIPGHEAIRKDTPSDAGIYLRRLDRCLQKGIEVAGEVKGTTEMLMRVEPDGTITVPVTLPLGLVTPFSPHAHAAAFACPGVGPPPAHIADRLERAGVVLIVSSESTGND